MHLLRLIQVIVLMCCATFTLPPLFAGSAGPEKPPSTTPASPAWTMPPSHAVVSFGVYLTRPRGEQHINIQGLIGDNFLADENRHSNGLVGVGYFLDAKDTAWYNLSVGANLFYLPKTFITGEIQQEDILTTNHAYLYTVRHYPLYADFKLKLKVFPEKQSLIFDAGLGPNFMKTAHFQERSIRPVALPNYGFSGQNSTTLSVTAGIALRLEHVFGEAPLECGYRFFYLGHSNLVSDSTQVLDRLSTRNIYANAVVCSFII
jgi:hypothetical protein